MHVALFSSNVGNVLVQLATHIFVYVFIWIVLYHYSLCIYVCYYGTCVVLIKYSLSFRMCEFTGYSNSKNNYIQLASMHSYQQLQKVYMSCRCCHIIASQDMYSLYQCLHALVFRIVKGSYTKCKNYVHTYVRIYNVPTHLYQQLQKVYNMLCRCHIILQDICMCSLYQMS